MLAVKYDIKRQSPPGSALYERYDKEIAVMHDVLGVLDRANKGRL